MDIALKWQSLGAPRIHIVDLDGAATGTVQNLEIIRVLAKAVLIPVQLGGGIRSLEAIEELLKVEVERVILGTAAVENPQLIKEACRRFNDAIIVSLDTRDGYVSTHGWSQDTEITAIELARSLIQLGVKRFIHTDISRDGTLTEPNFTSIYELVNEIRVPVIAAGGISSLSHLKMLSQMGVEGAIVGKALYSGEINLKQALASIS